MSFENIHMLSAEQFPLVMFKNVNESISVNNNFCVLVYFYSARPYGKHNIKSIFHPLNQRRKKNTMEFFISA